MTPWTARRRDIIRATSVCVGAQPIIVIAGADDRAAERIAAGRAGARQAHVAVERLELDVVGRRERQVAQRALPVEARRGQAADGLDAGVRERLEVGVRPQRVRLGGRGLRNLLRRLEIGLALLDRVGGQHVAGESGHGEGQDTQHQIGADALSRLRITRGARRLLGGTAHVCGKEIDGTHRCGCWVGDGVENGTRNGALRRHFAGRRLRSAYRHRPGRT